MDDVEDIEDYVDFEGQADHLHLLQWQQNQIKLNNRLDT
jgi:hypothetical protein